MAEKTKNKKSGFNKFSILQVVILTVAVTFICPMTMFRGLLGESDDPVERITTHFEITIDEASDLHYRATFDIKMTLRTLVRYTVPAGEVESSLSTTYHPCLLVERQSGFMPEFDLRSRVEWWNPGEAINFEGATCIDDEVEDFIIEYQILVAYQENGQAIVYIEQD